MGSSVLEKTRISEIVKLKKDELKHPFLYNYFTNTKIVFEVTNSLSLILIGGFLVGLGTKMSSGCTSGHGICGISRFSIRSIIATITFIISGLFTVFILQLYGIHL